MFKAAQEISRTVLAAGKFLHLDAIHFVDAAGKQRVWESAERTGDAKAVLMVAELLPSRRVILVRQHRPPARGLVWELPAGIIDGDEMPQQAAMRELLEETGYRGKIDLILPAAYSSPGMSSEQAYLIKMSIDETTAENQNPVPQPDEGEAIEVRLVPRDQLMRFIRQETAAGGKFDNKLVSFACGLQVADKGE